MISLDAFMPDDATASRRANENKSPGFEVSVNWEDDEHALATTRADLQNAAHGVARCHASDALRLMEKIDARVDATLERDIKPGNGYHGNIVFGIHLSAAQLRRPLAATFATASRLVDEGGA